MQLNLCRFLPPSLWLCFEFFGSEVTCLGPRHAWVRNMCAWCVDGDSYGRPTFTAHTYLLSDHVILYSSQPHTCLAVGHESVP